VKTLAQKGKKKVSQNEDTVSLSSRARYWSNTSSTQESVFGCEKKPPPKPTTPRANRGDRPAPRQEKLTSPEILLDYEIPEGKVRLSFPLECRAPLAGKTKSYWHINKWKTKGVENK